MSSLTRKITQPNWLHLDLKGAIPSFAELSRWLEFFVSIGFNGIVWEYEDRIPWRSWPGVYRAGYSLEEWRILWRRCEELGLEVTPLVQTHGHLEWLLKHEEYSAWRENGQFSEVCPQHPEVVPALKRWLDEVIALHPQSTLIHIGGDETFYLATCPLCREKATAAPHGKVEVYLEHCRTLCEFVIARGKRPMLWADAFWPEETRELVRELPSEVVLLDWQYGWLGPTELTPRLDNAGHELWPATAVRCSFDQKLTLAPVGERLKNIAIWQRQMDAGAAPGILHTFWSRTHSLGKLYGPWESWLPAFIAAANPQAWSTHPLNPLVAEVDAAMKSAARSDELVARLERIETDDLFSQRCLQWWILSLRHKELFHRAVERTFGYCGFEAVTKNVGADPFRMRKMEQGREALFQDLDTWECEARRFWKAGQWSDGDEYFGSRVNNLRLVLNAQMAS